MDRCGIGRVAVVIRPGYIPTYMRGRQIRYVCVLDDLALVLFVSVVCRCFCVENTNVNGHRWSGEGDRVV
jgi:hypothetical protein